MERTVSGCGDNCVPEAKKLDTVVDVQKVSTLSACPFSSLHNQNKNLCELLGLLHTGDDVGEWSSKVGDKIWTIFHNLQDWSNSSSDFALSSLEKLSRIIIHADVDAVKARFCSDDFLVFQKLVQLYKNEKRCRALFRYWCILHNLMSRQIVPWRALAQSGLLEELKKDLLLATESKCRCNANENEHKEFSPIMRCGVTSILLIPLYSELANLIVEENPVALVRLNPEEEFHFSLSILKLICDYKSPLVYPHFSSETDDNVEFIAGKSLLAHLILAQNTCFGSSIETNPILKALKEFDADCSQFWNLIFIILVKELNLLSMGHTNICSAMQSSEGIAPSFTYTLGLQLNGVNGPLKLCMDVLASETKSENSSFTNEELSLLAAVARYVLSLVQEMRKMEDESDFLGEVQENCKILLNFSPVKEAEFKMGKIFAKVDYETIELTTELPPASINLLLSSALRIGCRSTILPPEEVIFSPSVKQKSSGCESLIKMDKPGNSSKYSRLLTGGIDIVLKIFGCHKRTLEVFPSSKNVIRSIEYMK